MDTPTIFALILGVFLRLVLPLLLTALIVYGLRALDIRWQREAETERSLLIRDEEPCWRERGLSLDEIKARAAAGGKPCWQVHRLSNGYLREACLDCEVFLEAPAPALEHSTARA